MAERQLDKIDRIVAIARHHGAYTNRVNGRAKRQAVQILNRPEQPTINADAMLDDMQDRGLIPAATGPLIRRDVQHKYSGVIPVVIELENETGPMAPSGLRFIIDKALATGSWQTSLGVSVHRVYQPGLYTPGEEVRMKETRRHKYYYVCTFQGSENQFCCLRADGKFVTSGTIRKAN